MPRTHRRREEWLTLIGDYEQSGQTQTAFCAERGLNPKYFSLKRSQLGQTDKLPKDTSSRFVRATASSYTGIKLRVGNVCIELPPDYSLDHLSRLVLAFA